MNVIVYNLKIYNNSVFEAWMNLRNNPVDLEIK